MIDENAVVKELAVKNREIFIKKLNMDLDSCHSLLNTMINSDLTSFKNELIDCIYNIWGNSISNQYSTIITTFFQNWHNNLIKIIDNYFNSLKNKIENDDYIDNINENIFNEMKEYYQNHYKDLILFNHENQYNMQRLNDYLVHFYNDKVFIRLFSTLYNVNLILKNNYRESLERYQLLSENTEKLK